eukprot:gene2698-545_t
MADPEDAYSDPLTVWADGPKARPGRGSLGGVPATSPTVGYTRLQNVTTVPDFPTDVLTSEDGFPGQADDCPGDDDYGDAPDTAATSPDADLHGIETHGQEDPSAPSSTDHVAVVSAPDGWVDASAGAVRSVLAGDHISEGMPALQTGALARGKQQQDPDYIGLERSAGSWADAEGEGEGEGEGDEGEGTEFEEYLPENGPDHPGKADPPVSPRRREVFTMFAPSVGKDDIACDVAMYETFHTLGSQPGTAAATPVSKAWTALPFDPAPGLDIFGPQQDLPQDPNISAKADVYQSHALHVSNAGPGLTNQAVPHQDTDELLALDAAITSEQQGLGSVESQGRGLAHLGVYLSEGKAFADAVSLPPLVTRPDAMDGKRRTDQLVIEVSDLLQSIRDPSIPPPECSRLLACLEDILSGCVDYAPRRAVVQHASQTLLPFITDRSKPPADVARALRILHCASMAEDLCLDLLKAGALPPLLAVVSQRAADPDVWWWQSSGNGQGHLDPWVHARSLLLVLARHSPHWGGFLAGPELSGLVASLIPNSGDPELLLVLLQELVLQAVQAVHSAALLVEAGAVSNLLRLLPSIPPTETAPIEQCLEALVLLLGSYPAQALAADPGPDSLTALQILLASPEPVLSLAGVKALRLLSSAPLVASWLSQPGCLQAILDLVTGRPSFPAHPASLPLTMAPHSPGVLSLSSNLRLETLLLLQGILASAPQSGPLIASLGGLEAFAAVLLSSVRLHFPGDDNMNNHGLDFTSAGLCLKCMTMVVPHAATTASVPLGDLVGKLTLTRPGPSAQDAPVNPNPDAPANPKIVPQENILLHHVVCPAILCAQAVAQCAAPTGPALLAHCSEILLLCLEHGGLALCTAMASKGAISTWCLALGLGVATDAQETDPSAEHSRAIMDTTAGLLVVAKMAADAANEQALEELDTGIIAQVVLSMADNPQAESLQTAAGCVELLTLSLPPSLPGVSQTSIDKMAAVGLDPFALVVHLYSRMGASPDLRALVAELGACLNSKSPTSFAGLLWTVIGDLQGMSLEEIISTVACWSSAQVQGAAIAITEVAHVDVVMSRAGLGLLPDNWTTRDTPASELGTRPGPLGRCFPPPACSSTQKSFEAEVIPKVERHLHNLLSGKAWNVVSVLGGLCNATITKQSIGCIDSVLCALQAFTKSPDKTLQVMGHDPHIIPFLLEVLWGLHILPDGTLSTHRMVSAAEILEVLCQQPEAWSILSAHHGMDVLIRAVRTNHQDATLAHSLLMVLEKVPRDRKVRDLLVSLSSAVPAILDTIELYPHNTQLHIMCLNALRSVVMDNETLAVCLYNDGGLDLLYDCLSPTQPDVHVAAGRLLQQLATVPSLHAPMMAEGGLANIMSSLQDCPRLPAEAVSHYLGAVANIAGYHSQKCPDSAGTGRALLGIMRLFTTVASRFVRLGPETRLIDLPYCAAVASATRISHTAAGECIDAGTVPLLTHFAAEALTALLPSVLAPGDSIFLDRRIDLVPTNRSPAHDLQNLPPKHNACPHHISSHHGQTVLLYCLSAFMQFLVSGSHSAFQELWQHGAMRLAWDALPLLESEICGQELQSLLLRMTAVSVALPHCRVEATSALLERHRFQPLLVSVSRLDPNVDSNMLLSLLWILSQVAAQAQRPVSCDPSPPSKPTLIAPATEAVVVTENGPSGIFNRAFVTPWPSDIPQTRDMALPQNTACSVPVQTPAMASPQYPIAAVRTALSPGMINVYVQIFEAQGGNSEPAQALSHCLSSLLLCCNVDVRDDMQPVEPSGDLLCCLTLETLLLSESILLLHQFNTSVAINCLACFLPYCVHKPDMIKSSTGISAFLPRVLALHFAFPTAVMLGLWCLFHLASGNWDALLGAGVLDTLAACLAHHQEVAGDAYATGNMAAQSFSAIRSAHIASLACLLSVARNQGQIAPLDDMSLRLDLIPNLSNTMRVFWEDSEILAMTISLLCVLCYDHTDCCRTVLDLGTVPLVLEAMKNFPRENSLQSVGCGLLGLMAEVPECREALLGLRTLDVIMGAAMPFAKDMASEQVDQIYSVFSSLGRQCVRPPGSCPAHARPSDHLAASCGWIGLPALANWCPQSFNVPCPRGTPFSVLASCGWALAAFSMPSAHTWGKVLLSGLVQAVEAGAASRHADSDLDDRQRQVCYAVLHNFPDQEGMTRSMREVLNVGVLRQKAQEELRQSLSERLAVEQQTDRVHLSMDEAETRSQLQSVEALDRRELLSDEWAAGKKMLQEHMRRENMKADIRLSELQNDHSKLQHHMETAHEKLSTAEAQAASNSLEASQLLQELQQSQKALGDALCFSDGASKVDAWTQRDADENTKALRTDAEAALQRALIRERDVDHREWAMYAMERAQGTLEQTELLQSAREGRAKVWERELACLADHLEGVEHLLNENERLLRERELFCGALETRMQHRERTLVTLQQETETWRQELHQRDYEVNQISEELYMWKDELSDQAQNLLELSTSLQTRLSDVVSREDFIEACEASVGTREEDFVTREVEIAQRLADLDELEQRQEARDLDLNIRQYRLSVVEDKEKE